MDSAAIDQNRAAVKYTGWEQWLRVLWCCGSLLFRLSPRPCFGFRRWLLRCFGASVGSEVHIYPSARIYFPWNLRIGDWSSIGEWALIYNLGQVTIGERATLSQNVHVCAGTHDYTDPALPLIKPPINIGDSAWVCADAFVGPGVSIAQGAVVGARSVVVKDVPAWTVVAGNPARMIKQRTLRSPEL
ncbi:MAG: WcaF family extracellular polysaccharide biosynthesis acetyltransferase [Prosthecobacter sp.]|nr:WcaF family extracellular polysaccharide biosynthesis acetyltransferase [Prosthecobacter sp.]